MLQSVFGPFATLCMKGLKKIYFRSFQWFWKRKWRNNIIKVWKQKLLAYAKFFFNKFKWNIIR